MNWSMKPTRRRSVLSAAALGLLYTLHMLYKGSGGRDHESSDDGENIAAAVAADGLDSRERAILDWRIDNLLRAGFDELRANTLAAVGDWRRAIELVEDGCEHHVAADICI